MPRALVALLIACLASAAFAQETPKADPPVTQPEAEAEAADRPMSFERLQNILIALDETTQRQGFNFQLTLDDVPVLIMTDPIANRMRAMVPIRDARAMSADEMLRVMQANFDTALDARYAVANGRLWSVFIHPLKELERDQLVSGLVQTINVARTYGTTYSGGAIIFGQGDSPGLYRELLDELLEKGEEL